MSRSSSFLSSSSGSSTMFRDERGEAGTEVEAKWLERISPQTSMMLTGELSNSA